MNGNLLTCRSGFRSAGWAASRWALWAAAVAVLAGCASSANLSSGSALADAAMPASIQEVIEPIAAYAAVTPESASPLPTPTATPESNKPLRVTITSQIRANLRSGPATTFEIVGKANPGLTFEVLDQSEDGRWYKVAANLPGVDGELLESGWVATELVGIPGADGSFLPVVENALLDDTLAARWAVHWECESDRCPIRQCDAEVDAVVNRQAAGGFLPIEHTVTWDEACFSTDAWTFEVDQVTGAERTGEAKQNFLYSYWLGANPGTAMGVLPLGDTDQGVSVYCSGPHAVEIEEGGGWTTVYQGNTCHDVETGMLVFLNYTKRWLFTGDYDGKTYTRAFFGDVERMEQRLLSTSAPVSLVVKR